ncbi:MAG TPA: glycosyltransferase family 2 protein [Polyangiales bacterium]|jgi:glycosyltransferase involved in cell wall biosynthesis|nr:glycosyltransferase family 2 protein [Polyangiales bacterium]
MVYELDATYLSIVVPIYNEAESVELLVREVHAALDPTGLDYELICVDDGSRDKSFELLAEIAKNDPRLVVGTFRRNFGQTAAMQAGISAARGQIVVTLDADLQNDPADIPRMLAKLDEGFDMVAGWRADRKDTFINRRLPSILANWLISRTTNVRLHDYGCTLKVMRSDVAKELRLYGEMHRFIPVMASLVGARITELPVHHRARQFGKSKYGIGRTLRVLLDLVTVLFLRSYLVRPMQVFGLAGLVSLFSGMCISAYLTWEKFALREDIGTRPLLLLGVMLILVGIQLLSLGLVADVASRTYHEAQGRPPYYVRTWVNRSATKPAPPNIVAGSRGV